MANSSIISDVAAALIEHCPRPPGDPAYVPYYAKGRLGTRFTTQSGVVVHCGEVVSSTRPGETLKKPEAIDIARELGAAVRSPEEVLALCAEHDIDPVIWHSAPNKGVGKMRVVNALRSKLNV